MSVPEFHGQSGQPIPATPHPRHTHAEWLNFLRKIYRETPEDKTLHLMAENCATRKDPVVQKGLAKHPRFT